MSDVLYHPTVTATQRAAQEQRSRLWAIAKPPVVIQIKQAAPEPTPPPPPPRVIWKSDEELAFGPVVHPKRTRPTIAAIIEATAKFFCLPVDEILSPRRNNYLVTPRHVAMYLAEVHTLHTRRDIGRAIDGRDHSTVHHGVNSIQSRVLFEDAEIICAIDSILADLSGKFTVNA